ncbi:MAG: biopolymer transporter ExbD [Methylotenera sp.]|jgi:biopolymer transport protein ExbD|nr:biopolymer transporter ExbD [Methylotenera sp.]NOT64678.1 biopolymer transporter ExbD [Methylotenera sp.]
MSMSMPKEGGEPDVIAEMNTTPLIDVMLVLLIMLIITIPIQTHAVKLNMPTGNPPALSEPPKVVQIDIAANGTVTWNGSVMATKTELEENIKAAAATNPQPEIHLRPDKTANYEVVAMVMALSQRLGLSKMGLTGSEQFAD